MTNSNENIKWTNKVTAIAAIVTTLAALGTAWGAIRIPFEIAESTRVQNQKRQEIARETRTLEIMNDLSRSISGFIDAKNELDKELDKSKNKSEEIRFSFAYINGNKKVESLVFKLLNEYNFVCLGAKEKLYDEEIIQDIRGDALFKTWVQYYKYILEYRDNPNENTSRVNDNKNAWIYCDELIKKNPDKKEELDNIEKDYKKSKSSSSIETDTE